MLGNKHRENLALYNVLNNEVVFEEYFCNLLRIDVVRDIFVNFINQKIKFLPNSKEIKYANFDTEIILENENDNFGRADLYLQVENKEYIFEIKNKLRTDLTNNQPEGYLKYLDNNSQLFFLLPKGYMHEADIIERWKEHNKYDDVKNHIFYWEDLILKLKNNPLLKENVSVEIFVYFCNYWFDIDNIEFTNNEMELMMNNKESGVPSLMIKLESLVIKISKEANLKKSDISELGFFYEEVINDYTISCGIDYYVWEQTNQPINIFITYKDPFQYVELPKLNIDFKIESFKYNESKLFDSQYTNIVKLNLDVNNEDYSDDVVNKIKIIKEAFHK